MPQYISALTWRGMFNAEYGAINLMLRQWLHLPGIPWQSDPFWAFVAPIVVNIWLGFPFIMVVTLGGLSAIPAQLYEAADLDGASSWQKFRYIILPGIRPVVGLSVILAISGSLSVFEIPYIMTLGANGSETFVIQTIYLAFKFHKFGLASAMAVILLAIVLLITFIQRRVLPDEKRAPS